MNMKQMLPVLALVVAPAMAQDGMPDRPLHGVYQAYMNKDVKPSEDFYAYACGGWMKDHPLTPEYSRYGSFDVLIENNNEQLRGFIEELAAKRHPAGSIEQKIADQYNCVMDSAGLNKRGDAVLQASLEPVRKATDKAELFKLATRWQRMGVPGLFNFYIDADIKNSTMNLLQFYQGGLTLGEREYYLDTDKATSDIRNQYKKHVERMFLLSGFGKKEAARNRDAVMRIETQMAKVAYSAVERRDPEKNYHKMTYDELKRDYNGIDWDMYFALLGIENLVEVSVSQPEPLAEACRIWQEGSFEDVRAYLLWCIIDTAAPCLTDQMQAANFDFYGKVLSGKQEDRPRWKKAVSAVDGALGEAVGQIYVRKYFSPEAKERMEKLVRNLQVALAGRILDQSWMSNETKMAALDKLMAFRVKIGYPEKWRSYAGLDITSDYWQNRMNCNAFDFDDMVARKLNKPVDAEEWYMTPQTVNAYYNPTTNEICFPAGILQPPFFDMERDDASNYGAIGVVIGHEMTHGFDDQGRQFDKEGNLQDWWAPGDADRFKAIVQPMVTYFDHIEVLPGLKANGSFTLGENLADHGGLNVAFQAMKNASREQPLHNLDGLTPEQRFFISYAHVWAGNIRDEEIRRRTKSDPHSLGCWRVNGALPHIDAWYEAFGVTSDSPMFVPKDKRVHLW